MSINHSLPPDEELVKRLLAHDEQAFADLIRAYQSKMWRLARTLVGETAAGEVVQETWLAVLKGLPNFEGRARLETWILRILSNVAKTRLRRDLGYQQRHIRWEEVPSASEQDRFDSQGRWRSPPLPWSEETPEAILASEELRHCLAKAIEALPPTQRTIFTLRDTEGFAMEDICNILEISATNSRVLLHRARSRLRTVVENYQKGKGC